RPLHNSKRKRAGEAGNVDGEPDQVARSRPPVLRQVTAEGEHAPQHHDQARDLIDPRTADALGDVFDIMKRCGGFVAVDHWRALRTWSRCQRFAAVVDGYAGPAASRSRWRRPS